MRRYVFDPEKALQILQIPLLRMKPPCCARFYGRIACDQARYNSLIASFPPPQKQRTTPFVPVGTEVAPCQAEAQRVLHRVEGVFYTEYSRHAVGRSEG
jgi:hypothetical protein